MRKTIEQKRLEFLEDTIAYYSEDVSRRAIDDQGKCCYLTSDNKKCAIGRYISEKKYNPTMEGYGVFASEVSKLLPKKILDLGTPFLADIQNLHDRDYFWNKNGLTEEGVNFKNRIIYKWCEKT